MRPRPSDTWLILRATGELAMARIRLGRQRPADLLGTTAPPPPTGAQADNPLAARIAWVMPRVAARLPWRADCLVQATAARRWLAGAGIETQLHIGVRKDRGGFEAHAWLCHGSQIVTGGDISGFHAFAPPAGPPPPQAS